MLSARSVPLPFGAVVGGATLCGLWCFAMPRAHAVRLPRALRMHKVLWLATLVAAIALGLWAALTPRRLGRRTRLLIYFGPVWYVLTMVPIAFTYASERHLYLPSAGFCVALGCLPLLDLSRADQRKRAWCHAFPRVAFRPISLLVLLAGSTLVSVIAELAHAGLGSRLWSAALALPVAGGFGLLYGSFLMHRARPHLAAFLRRQAEPGEPAA